MRHRGLESSFEKYAQDRRRRHAQKRGERRSEQAPINDVAAQIEAAEAREIHSEQLTREMHEFFEDATKTAASIVQRVSSDHEERSEERVKEEVAEFLFDAIRRAESFIQLLGMSAGSDGTRDIEAKIGNIVGPLLDEFRSEGTANLADKHFGEDPLAVEVGLLRPDAAPRQDGEPATAAAEARTDGPGSESAAADGAPLGMEEHLVAEVAGEPETGDDPPAARGHAEPTGLESDDPEQIKAALLVLVRAGVMSKDQAREIYRQRIAAAAAARGR